MRLRPIAHPAAAALAALAFHLAAAGQETLPADSLDRDTALDSTVSAPSADSTPPPPDAATAAPVSAGPDSSSGEAFKARPIHELDRMVVTATRTERRVSELPVSVTVLDRQEIDASPMKSATDLLQTKSGVVLARTVPIGEGLLPDIIIRGIPKSIAAARVLILVDDIPINASGTPFVLGSSIAAQGVEQLEIVRGPFSALYGANALSGVVNYRLREGVGRPRVEADADAGPWGFVRGGGWSGGGGSRLSYSVSGYGLGVDNYQGENMTLVRKGDTTYYRRVENHDGRLVGLFGKGRLQIAGNASITLHARYYYENVGFGRTKQDTITPWDSVPADINTIGQSVQVGPELKWNPTARIGLRAGIFLRSVDGRYDNEGILRLADDTAGGVQIGNPVYEESYWKSRSRDVLGLLTGTFKLGTSHVVSAGVDGLRNTIDFGAMRTRETDEVMMGSSGLDAGIYNAGVFLQDEIGLCDRIAVVPGVRIDYHSDFGTVVSPRLSGSVKIAPWVSARLSGGKAFRAPALSELYMPPLTINPELQMVPNPDLEPEQCWSAECGLDLWLLRRSWRTQVTGFYNNLENFITPVIITTNLLGPKRVSSRNTTRAWTAGVEAESYWSPVSWLTAYVSYALQQTRDMKFGGPLDYVPLNKMGLGLQARKPIGRFTVGGMLTANVVGCRSYREWLAPQSDWYLVLNNLQESAPPEIHLDPYFTTNMALRFGYKDLVWIGLQIWNLLDERYQESGSTAAPRRMGSIGLGVKF